MLIHIKLYFPDGHAFSYQRALEGRIAEAFKTHPLPEDCELLFSWIRTFGTDQYKDCFIIEVNLEGFTLPDLPKLHSDVTLRINKSGMHPPTVPEERRRVKVIAHPDAVV